MGVRVPYCPLPTHLGKYDSAYTLVLALTEMMPLVQVGLAWQQGTVHPTMFNCFVFVPLIWAAIRRRQWIGKGGGESAVLS